MLSTTNQRMYEQNHIQTLYQYADQLWRQKEYQKSQRICLKLLSRQYNHSDAHNRLATNYKALKQIHLAIKHYQLAIKYNPNNKTAHNNLGNVYCNNKETWNKAEECYKKAIAVDDNYANGHTNYAALLRKMEQPENAKHHYECAIKLGSMICL